ncbi:MAG: AMP-binding protein, partial [Gemmatimonadetes bacterium]|nr:AMP-binding protein [Gemmatimonadota bacterium]
MEEQEVHAPGFGRDLPEHGRQGAHEAFLQRLVAVRRDVPGAPQDHVGIVGAGRDPPQDGAAARLVGSDPATDIALLQYTGGTSGLSKGARLTHRNLVSNAHMNRLWDTEARPGHEVCLAVLPLFHAYGLGNGLSFPLYVGATAVQMTGRPTPDKTLATIEAHQPTVLFSV